GPGRDEYKEAGRESRMFAESLSGPYCISHPMFDTLAWFGEDGSRLRSFAYIPLKGREVTGLLVLGSEDPQRFYPQMGTLHLTRLGDLLASAIQRLRAGALPNEAG